MRGARFKLSCSCSNMVIHNFPILKMAKELRRLTKCEDWQSIIFP